MGFVGQISTIFNCNSATSSVVQRFLAFLMLWPLNAVSYNMVTPNTFGAVVLNLPDSLTL